MRILKVEIGYLPTKYYNSKPDECGFFSFAYEGIPQYVFTMGTYLPKWDEHFAPLWMNTLQAFPLYFCAAVPAYWTDEFNHLCRETKVASNVLSNIGDKFIFVTEIQNEEQLRQLFPFYITVGSGNDLVLWSTNEDVFHVEPRETREGERETSVVVTFGEETSVFWIGYDGTSLAVLSNHASFSTYDRIVHNLPEFVTSEEIDYE